jgi:hypothetical protein
VRLSATGWLTLIGLLLAGLIPFAVLGILLGHLIGPDSSALAVGGIVTLFALLGGVYGFQIATSGALFGVIKALITFAVHRTLSSTHALAEAPSSRPWRRSRSASGSPATCTTSWVTR